MSDRGHTSAGANRAPLRTPLCPLCGSTATRPLATVWTPSRAACDAHARARASEAGSTVSRRDYWRCTACALTFLDPDQRPSAEAERAFYLTHQNRADDPRYRAFLAPLAEPLIARLGHTPRDVLDFGCGPDSALAAILREAGHRVRLYDPFFHDDRAALSADYDAITCTEVVEHLHRPGDILERLTRQLRPGGILAVMTEWPGADAAFARWRYRRDPTHVGFFRPATFQHLAAVLGLRYEVVTRNVVFLIHGQTHRA